MYGNARRKNAEFEKIHLIISLFNNDGNINGVAGRKSSEFTDELGGIKTKFKAL